MPADPANPDTGPGDALLRGSLLLVAAHPDDEIIGAGAQLARYGSAFPGSAFPGAVPAIVHVTDGAPRDRYSARTAGHATPEAYARARHRESEDALAIAGIPPDRLFTLDFADQQAALHLAEVVRRLLPLIEAQAPDTILTHAYEGGHPDHDAAAFAVHAAVALLHRRNQPAPAMAEMASYHADPASPNPDRPRTVYLDFLPHPDIPVRTVMLSPVEQDRKRRMLACFPSQARILAPFPIDRERFRPTPGYDFVRPPHAGRLHYEWFDWGMTAHRWRKLATAALIELGLMPEGPP